LGAGADEDHPIMGGQSRKVTGGYWSAVGSFSDLGARSCEVCFAPMNRHRHVDRLRPKSAKPEISPNAKR
jgi:hypothetical protein